MGVNAYRLASARPDYPSDVTANESARGSAPNRVVGGGQSTRGDASVMDNFDVPFPVDDHEHYSPPRWLTDMRVTKGVYAIILAGMVLVFVVGFRP